MKHNVIALTIIIASLTGCTGGTFNITSDTPARIEKDGVTACKSTPCKVGGNYYKNNFGECVGPAYTMLEAFPLDDSGTTQSKRVFGDCGEKYDVHFEMSSTKGIKTYSGDKQTSSEKTKGTLKSRLHKLDVLLKDKVISPQEHKDRRQQILNEI